jgi:hypothetical protein
MTPRQRAKELTVRLAQAAIGALELRDACFFAGLGLAAYGGAQLSAPWTCIVLGAVLVLKVWSPPAPRGP